MPCFGRVRRRGAADIDLFVVEQRLQLALGVAIRPTRCDLAHALLLLRGHELAADVCAAQELTVLAERAQP